MKYCIYLILSIFILNSCSNNEFDAEEVAKRYCDCLEKKNKKGDFFSARTICDGELLQSNKFFRVSYIEANYGRYMVLLSEGLRDSVAKFHLRFGNYIEKNCCKVAVLNCNDQDSLQIMRKEIDSNNVSE